MKKVIALLVTIFTLAFSSFCFAADGGDLNKEQNAAEAFVQAFSLETSNYIDFSKGFDATLKEKITETVYKDLQKQVYDKFGKLKESKFYSFQRYDDIDQVTYIASFSKQELVTMTFIFNKKNKMTDFALSPMQANAAENN